ncbi:protein phosphatase 2C domain-containing protein [Pyruvatibacter sp.]|uniref:PP2C family protein-serine/threonine phosphatase n=1 Tax=Pyruvatibacter sp. TaxID=1981328 RepID=UPI0032ED1D6B
MPRASHLTIDQEAPEQRIERRLASGVVRLRSTPSPLRPRNEDCAGVVEVDDRRAVLMVCDGLGGHAGGAEASRLVVETITEAVEAAANDGLGGEESMRPAILNGIERANALLLELGIGSASTLGLIELDGMLARPYHVGDTSILIVGQRGRVKLKTVDHAPVAYAHAAGQLSEYEAIHHHHRHIVDNVVGSRDMRIEIGAPVRLSARDTLLIASDGLFDNLFPGEINRRIRTGPLETALGSVCDLAAGRMRRIAEPGVEAPMPSKPDDLTVVMYRPTAHVDDHVD